VYKINNAHTFTGRHLFGRQRSRPIFLYTVHRADKELRICTRNEYHIVLIPQHFNFMLSILRLLEFLYFNHSNVGEAYTPLI